MTSDSSADRGLGNVRLIRGAVYHGTAGEDRDAGGSRRPTARVGDAAGAGKMGVGGRRSAAATGGERALEGVPEVAVEERVDERIERRVDVADPEQNGHDDRRRRRAQLAAQRVVDVPREERQPAAEERAHDDARPGPARPWLSVRGREGNRRSGVVAYSVAPMMTPSVLAALCSRFIFRRSGR